MSALYEVFVVKKEPLKVIFELVICHVDEYYFHEEKVFAWRILRSSYWAPKENRPEWFTEREANGYLEMKKARIMIDSVKILETSNYPREYDSLLDPRPSCILEVAVFDPFVIEHLQAGMSFDTAAYAGTGGESFSNIERTIDDQTFFTDVQLIDPQIFSIGRPVFYKSKNCLFYHQDGLIDYQNPIVEDFQGYYLSVSPDGNKCWHWESEVIEDDDFIEYYVCRDNKGKILYQWSIEQTDNIRNLQFLPDSSGMIWQEKEIIFSLNFTTLEIKEIVQFENTNEEIEFYLSQSLEYLYFRKEHWIIRLKLSDQKSSVKNLQYYMDAREQFQNQEIAIFEMEQKTVELPRVSLSDAWGETCFNYTSKYYNLPSQIRSDFFKSFKNYEFSYLYNKVQSSTDQRYLQIWYAAGKEADEGFVDLHENGTCTKVLSFVQGPGAIYDLSSNNWLFLPNTDYVWMKYLFVSNEKMSDAFVIDLKSGNYFPAPDFIAWASDLVSVHFLELYLNTLVCVPRLNEIK